MGGLTRHAADWLRRCAARQPLTPDVSPPNRERAWLAVEAQVFASSEEGTAQARSGQAGVGGEPQWRLLSRPAAADSVQWWRRIEKAGGAELAAKQIVFGVWK